MAQKREEDAIVQVVKPQAVPYSFEKDLANVVKLTAMIGIFQKVKVAVAMEKNSTNSEDTKD